MKGFSDAIATAYPETQIQLCIVHMVRNSLKSVPWKDYKVVTSGLKQIIINTQRNISEKRGNILILFLVETGEIEYQH